MNFPGLPGSAGVGTHGGSEDHTAILACQTDHVSLYRFVPVRPLGDTRMPADWTFVIASSGVQADKADSVKDRYNRAADGVRALHAIWNTHAAAPARSLADALASSADAIEQLTSRLEPSADGRFSVADLQAAAAALHPRNGARAAGGGRVSRRRSRRDRRARRRSRSAKPTSCSATRFRKRS